MTPTVMCYLLITENTLGHSRVIAGKLVILVNIIALEEISPWY